MELTADERTLLQRLRSLDSNTVVRLRTALAWDIARFASTLIGLEERGLVERNGIRFAITAVGAAHLYEAVKKRRTAVITPYKESSSIPAMPVDALYLPDHNRFLRALHRKLYTTDVSHDSPE